MLSSPIHYIPTQNLTYNSNGLCGVCFCEFWRNL